MCPNAGSQIYYTGNWFGPSSNSTDYFNKCSSVSMLSPPTCGSGYQDTKSGNGMAGIWVHGGNGNYREYLMSNLIGPLQINKCYHVSFYCNLANNSKLSIKSLGIAVTTNSYITAGSSSNNVINVPNPIYKYDKRFLTDTLNWIKVEGVYSANGTEQYIIIGNFNDDASTDTLGTNHGNYYYSYYLVEDVNIEVINSPFWSYRDTTVAIGDSVLIGPYITGLNINWYDATGTFITNAPGIYVKPNAPTFYTATEDFCGSTITYTINVGVSPVGVKELGMKNADLSIFPNPATNVLNINLKSNEILNPPAGGQHDGLIKITDVLGKEILVSDYKEQLDISVLEKGIYFLSLYQNNQLLVTKKVVKV